MYYDICSYYKQNNPIHRTHRHIRPYRNTARRSIDTVHSYTGKGIQPGCAGKHRGPGSTAAEDVKQTSCFRRSLAHHRRTNLPTHPICRRTSLPRCTIRTQVDTDRHRTGTYTPDTLEKCNTYRRILPLIYYSLSSMFYILYYRYDYSYKYYLH